jgi:hypothetical protein
MFTACVRCPGEVLKTVLRLCASVDVNPGYGGRARTPCPRPGLSRECVVFHSQYGVREQR